MKQIICDICGKVNKGTNTELNLPTLHGGFVIQSHDHDCALDVCQPCSLELCRVIDKFILMKKGGKINE